MKIRREEHMAGGNGHVIIKEILDAEQLNGKCGLYAQVTASRNFKHGVK
mgnify:CR=1 FL=1